MNDEQTSTKIPQRDVWGQHLEQWKSSGLSMRGYCRHEGVSFYALRYWREKLHGERRDRRPVKLPASLSAAEKLPGAIEIVVAERFTVKVAHGFEASELERLIRSLEALR